MDRKLAQVVVLLACTAAGFSQSLSLNDAINSSANNSPIYRASEARVRQAQARLTGSAAFLSPVLILAQPFGKDTGGLDEDIFISQTVELGDKRRQRVRSANAERLAAIADRRNAYLTLQFNVRSAYIEVLRSSSERTLASETLKSSEAFAKAADIQFGAGDVPQINVLRSSIELSRARTAYAAVETEYANRLAALYSLMGSPLDSNVTLTDKLEFKTVSYDLAKLETAALNNRPDILSAEKLQESRAASFHLSRVTTQPDLFFEGRHSTLDLVRGGNSLRVGLTITPFDFGKARSTANEAKFALNEQQLNVAEVKRAALLEVGTAYRTLELTKQTVLSFQKERLTQARNLLDMAQIGYEYGASTYLEYLDALHLYQLEQTDYTRALADYNIALASLERAVGGDLSK